jgi:cytochrome c biogenesis protein CcmG/thiol:disulfide interchange protein DsbE
MVESGVPAGAVAGNRAEPPSAAGGRRVRVAFVAAALVAGLAVATLLGYGLSRGTDSTGSTSQPVGTLAPDFRLPSLAGSDISLADYRGRPVFVYFWASWCLPCRDEAPVLETAWREFRDSGLVIIGINIQDSDDAASGFVQEYNMTFPVARDRDGRVYIDYGVYGVPESFFVGADGRIVQRWIGPLDLGQIRTSLEKLVTG